MKFKMHRTMVVAIIFINATMMPLSCSGMKGEKSEKLTNSNNSNGIPTPTYEETCEKHAPQIPSTRIMKEQTGNLKIFEDGNIVVCANQTKFLNYMEDKFDIRRNYVRKISLFAVYDGHGGAYVAQCAASNLLNNIDQEILRHDKNDINYEEILKSEIKNFDKKLKAVYDYEFPRYSKWHIPQSGSTALIGLIDENNNKLYVANLGDSHGEMCCDDDGNPIELSTDFDIINRPEEKKRIEGVGGTTTIKTYEGIPVVGRVYAPNYEGNLGLTRALGDYEYKANYKNPVVSYEAEVRPFDLTKNLKYILFASDGGWPRTDYLEIDKKKAIDTINENFDKEFYGAKNLCTDIEETNMSLGNADNITVMVVELKDILSKKIVE